MQVESSAYLFSVSHHVGYHVVSLRSEVRVPREVHPVSRAHPAARVCPVARVHPAVQVQIPVLLH